MSLAHSFGGAFHTPHGRLNAIFLPAVIEANAASCGAKYASLARKAGLSSGSDAMALRALKNAIIRLRRSLQLPETLAQAGIELKQLSEKSGELINATSEDPCCKTNPMTVEDFMIRRILEEVAGRV